MGETKEIIKYDAINTSYNQEDIFLVDSMDQAVDLAYKLADSGDNILLSPASASWDQYKTFEERGNLFIESIKTLTEIQYLKIEL